MKLKLLRSLQELRSSLAHLHLMFRLDPNDKKIKFQLIIVEILHKSSDDWRKM